MPSIPNRFASRASILCALFLAFTVGYAPLDAGAAISKKKQAKRQKNASSAAARKRRGRRKKKVLRVKRIKLKGSRHKPEAVYFLYRSKTRFDQRALKRKGHIKRVIRSVGRTPF